MNNMKHKWNTLEHSGPLFPKKYEYKKYRVFVKGKSVILNEIAEEMAYAWAAKTNTPYVQDDVFQKNFWKDFVLHLPKDLQETKFPEDWNFNEIYLDIVKTREEKKNLPKAVKDEEKKRREELKAIYGRAKLDGVDVELGAYIVEPSGLFMGRGQHPLRGRWKVQAQPEDITINLSKGSKIPVPPEGHHWKEVVENKNAFWTCMWHDNLSGAQKKILFGATSFVKQNADKKKFTKAINLAKNWDKVVEHIDKGLVSRDTFTRKVATVCKLIQTMSIRVGDEKDYESADTVGASSLRVEHIKIDGNKIEFDFLGKDSIRYHNIVEFDISTIRNIKEFIHGKSKNDMIFEEVSSSDVAEFLSSVLPGLTAKLFRTVSGSTLLANALKSKELDPSLKETKKLEFFTHANLEVAIKLNHQSAVSNAYDESINRMISTLESMKSELNQLKTNFNKILNEAKIERDNNIELAKKMKNSDRSKKSIERTNEKFKIIEEKLQNKIKKMKDRIETLETKIEIKKKTRGIALGTSKLNYSDPRIPISWCKANNVDIKRIYPITAQKKFSWALDVDSNFYKKYPMVED